MSRARQHFIEQIEVFSKLLKENVSLLTKNQANTPNMENSTKMLCNGLAIIGYLTLEDFIKNRLGEILQEIGNHDFSFDELNKNFKKKILLGTLSGLKFFVKNIENDVEKVSFLKEEFELFSNIGKDNFSISKYALGRDQSNVSENSFSEILKLFKVSHPWDKIKEMSQTIGSFIMDPKQEFINAAQRRHSAAHNSNSTVLYTDLFEYSKTAVSIAFGFDVLLTKSVAFLSDDTTVLKIENIKYREVYKEKGLWKHKELTQSKATKVDKNYEVIKNDALEKISTSKEVVIIKSESNAIQEWYI